MVGQIRQLKGFFSFLSFGVGYWQGTKWLALALCTGLLVIFTHVQVLAAEPTGSFHRVLSLEPSSTGAESSPAALPSLQVHPLPPVLANWQDATDSGDYFSQVEPVKVGYLIWSRFPVKIYIESAGSRSSQQWASAVLEAVREWNVYLPLEITEGSETADITIWHRRPPLQMSGDGNISRARSAETRYEFYISHPINLPAILSHRFTISLSPNQTGRYIQAAARHELGHALGIWGHSPLETDALYFSQVRTPPSISTRDINTLKRIYAQPTQLGWPMN